MATTAATTIGFVGLGHMGGGMASRLLDAGYPVYGASKNLERHTALVHDGLQWRETPRDVAKAADIVFTSLPDDGVLDAVASGPDGMLAGLATGKIWIDMSTVSPRASRELAARVHTLGATLLDAPVSGSVPQVNAGTLTIMVGGDEEAYGCVEPVLRHLGTGGMSESYLARDATGASWSEVGTVTRSPPSRTSSPTRTWPGA